MKIIGLTGPSGAGKGTAADLLAAYGVPHIDCDSIYHSLLTSGSDCTKALTAEFGMQILSCDGSVDRKKLSSLVFSGEGHEERLDRLNKITHNYVLQECRRLIEIHKQDGKRAVTVDAPTLFESGFDKECDIILVVSAPYSSRLDRITRRDGINQEKAIERLSAQKDDEFYISRADFVIENSSDLEKLKSQLEKFIREKLS